jgi:HEPN domain-containing protein
MPSTTVPAELLDRIVAHFHPQRVILFGSRARGEARRDSDIDLLVIVDNDTSEDKLTWRAGYEAHRTSHAADVFPMRADDFERDRAIVNTLAAEATADGIVVYGSPEGFLMKTIDPHARWEAVEDWRGGAEAHRRAAELCIAAGQPLPGVAAFHCQQAVEKLLKGFLTLAGKRGGKTHSLTQLGALAAASFPEIAELVAAAKGWSDWAFEFRYPPRRGHKPMPPPEEGELRRALAVIDTLAARMNEVNPEPHGS